MLPVPVLLPGNMCDARLWSGSDCALAVVLAEHSFPKPSYADATLDDSIAGMASRALSQTPGPILPIGFSMGAIVAVEMWCQAPERIQGLVLLGYNAVSDLPERARHRPAQQEEVRAGGLERVLVEELKPNYLAAESRKDLALLDLLREMGMGLGPDVFVAQSEALRLREDRVGVLPRIEVPVLYGCGTEDALCPPAWHRRWQTLTQDAEFAEFGEAGHMLPLEKPEALASAVSCWIKKKDLT